MITVREYVGDAKEIKKTLGYKRITRAGNVTEVISMQSKPKQPDILKVTKDIYCYKSTGEIGEYKHTKDRSEGKESLRKTFKRLRDIINTNATDGQCCLWVTLTYRENMRDHHVLQKDHENFYKRLKRYLIKKEEDVPEYIACVEPQGRGAWHMHILYIWKAKAPYIPNQDIAELWGKGFTKTEAVKDADNLGAYLSCYLTDVEVETDRQDNAIKVVEKEGQTKKIKKGGRLKYYPPGIKLFRCSQGIKRPETYIIDNNEKEVSLAGLTYEKIYELVDENGAVKNYICKSYYNSKRG